MSEKGQLLYPGSSYCKDIIVKNITLPKAVKANIEHSIHLLDRGYCAAFLPKRDAHSVRKSVGDDGWRQLLYARGNNACGEGCAAEWDRTLTLFLPDCISEIISK